MTDVVLIRPGCTDFDDQNRISGDLDLPMNVRGQGQVDELIETLRETKINVIYCDPTEPARSTAASVGEELGVRVKERDELRNVDHGLWQGLQVEDIKRKFPRAYKQWKDAPETMCPPEGESFPQALERIRKFLKKRLKKETPVAIVASEPLATIVRCVVQGDKPGLPANGGINPEVRVQVLTVNECESSESNGKAVDTSQDDSPRKSKATS